MDKRKISRRKRSRRKIRETDKYIYDGGNQALQRKIERMERARRLQIRRGIQDTSEFCNIL